MQTERVTFSTAQQLSADLFATQIFPVLQSHLGFTTFFATENQDNPLCKILDCQAGIDYILENPDGSLTTLASRIQSGHCWQTFTIRKSCRSGQITEWGKRTRDYKSCNLRPDLTCQAYCKSGQLLGLAVVKTDHLLETALKLKEERQLFIRDVVDGEFYYVEWHKLSLLLEVTQ